jgi:hypothetical protein
MEKPVFRQNQTTRGMSGQSAADLAGVERIFT